MTRRLNLVGVALAGVAMPTGWIVAARSSIYYPQIRQPIVASSVREFKYEFTIIVSLIVPQSHS
jgi:hypothetical protein